MMDNKELDLVLDYLNEGKITEAIHNKLAEKNIKAWIKSAEKFLATNGESINHSASHFRPDNFKSLVRQYNAIKYKYAKTKAYKQNKTRMEKLYDEITELNEKLAKEVIVNTLLGFKEKYWDKYKMFDIYCGAFLIQCMDAGIKPQDVITHYKKSNEKTSYKHFLNLYYKNWKSENVEKLDEDDEALEKCDLDDECLDFYADNEVVLIYNYSKNLLVELGIGMEFEILPISDLYCYIEDFSDGSSGEIAKIAREEGITFKV